MANIYHSISLTYRPDDKGWGLYPNPAQLDGPGIPFTRGQPFNIPSSDRGLLWLTIKNQSFETQTIKFRGLWPQKNQYGNLNPGNPRNFEKKTVEFTVPIGMGVIVPMYFPKSGDALSYSVLPESDPERLFTFTLGETSSSRQASEAEPTGQTGKKFQIEDGTLLQLHYRGPNSWEVWEGSPGNTLRKHTNLKDNFDCTDFCGNYDVDVWVFNHSDSPGEYSEFHFNEDTHFDGNIPSVTVPGGAGAFWMIFPFPSSYGEKAYSVCVGEDDPTFTIKRKR